MKRIFFASLTALSLALGTASIAHATTPNVGSFKRINASMDQRTVTIVPPTSTSPGRWSYTSSDQTVATISGNIITLVGRGYSRITATQAASGSYDSVTKVTELLVTKGDPVVGSVADITVPYTSQSAKITLPSNSSGLPWAVTNSNPGIATYRDGTLTFNDVGSLRLNFSQASNANWNSASTSMNVTILAVKPTLGVFGNISIGLGSVSSLNLTPPTSNSKGTWSFESSNSSVANVLGNMVFPKGIGTATITARQAQSLPYSSATASMVMTVTGAAANVNQWNDMNYDLSTTHTALLNPPISTSPGAWSFSIGDPSMGSISGSTLTLLKPGITSLIASQAASGTFNASGPYTAKLTVIGVPTITPPANQVHVAGDPAFTLSSPRSTSNGAFTFASSDASIIAINGNVATIVGAGIAVITATQAADSFWKSGTTSFSIQVNGLVPTISAWSQLTYSVGEKKAVTPPTSNSKGGWNFTSSDPTVIAIVDGVATAMKVGSVTITARQSPAGLYGLSNLVETKVTVNAAPTPAPSPSATPTPTPTVKPTPTPSATATPQPTPTPTAKPTIKPTTKPSVISLKVTTGVGTITVTSSSKTLVVFIDGEVKLLGKNQVSKGKHLVTIRDGAKVLYSKSVTVK